jgi:hypothetical protein
MSYLAFFLALGGFALALAGMIGLALRMSTPPRPTRSLFAVGQRVFLRRYGYGTVCAEPRGQMVPVSFDGDSRPGCRWIPATILEPAPRGPAGRGK